MPKKKSVDKKPSTPRRRPPRATVSDINLTGCEFNWKGPDATTIQELAKAINANAQAALELAKSLKGPDTILNIGPYMGIDKKFLPLFEKLFTDDED